MEENFREKRQQLVNALRGGGIYDERVLAALALTPRELFVDKTRQVQAYEDRALPIELGQTISQPLMVAVMTQALRLRGDERVLEIGTGSGYHTTILAQLAAHIYSVERHQQLAYEAARRVQLLALRNVDIYVGDGSLGWPQYAPYDRILVAAAAPSVPPNLLNQLAEWGVLVAPVGSTERQDLLVVQRTPQGLLAQSLGSCVFVPLVGLEGWHENLEGPG